MTTTERADFRWAFRRTVLTGFAGGEIPPQCFHDVAPIEPIRVCAHHIPRSAVRRILVRPERPELMVATPTDPEEFVRGTAIFVDVPRCRACQRERAAERANDAAIRARFDREALETRWQPCDHGTPWDRDCVLCMMAAHERERSRQIDEAMAHENPARALRWLLKDREREAYLAGCEARDTVFGLLPKR